jgi:hypothetical protein
VVSSFPRRAKFKSYVKTNNKSGQYIIPMYKVDEAKKFLEETLSSKLNNLVHELKRKDVKQVYKAVNNACNLTIQKYGTSKKQVNTDDKITAETKSLIEKREKIKGVRKMTQIQKIELAEINKLVRREIRKDCRNYEEKLTKEIIEDTYVVYEKMEERNKQKK